MTYPAHPLLPVGGGTPESIGASAFLPGYEYVCGLPHRVFHSAFSARPAVPPRRRGQRVSAVAWLTVPPGNSRRRAVPGPATASGEPAGRMCTVCRDFRHMRYRGAARAASPAGLADQRGRPAPRDEGVADAQ